MKSKIKELLKCQKICAVYTDSDFVDKFAVGYFLQLDEKYFLMECLHLKNIRGSKFTI